ncbi:unnamed protein product, partial [Brenthis ino]
MSASKQNQECVPPCRCEYKGRSATHSQLRLFPLRPQHAGVSVNNRFLRILNNFLKIYLEVIMLLISVRDDSHLPSDTNLMVQRWLDVHEKYFTGQYKSIQVPLTTHVAHRTNQPSQMNYYYSQPIQYTSRVVQMPRTLQAPHRISPMKPIYD